MDIEGFPLPAGLLALIDAGRWRCPADLSGLDRLFPDRGELCLFDFERMRHETSGLRRILGSPAGGGPGSDSRPNVFDPIPMVVVADLGIGYDQPIALDYRASNDAPRVVVLRWGASGACVGWVEIAPDFETFAALLGL